ncbi:UDP-glucose 4-epimerase GalE [Marilutibacter chinensis]|uniref:UDP-glucose 4-epimerase n=1 Tax=Marilutibacter chinensis TaxID=2912247 RepID=A0ABS9HQL4_9GAMM|nr:UDP-glucose 4-epimerase GalE [Lysobacter chinensis]MCF7220928.1 UDP-glucose 4-epimerase GalE [Lysobacter chinensis]
MRVLVTGGAGYIGAHACVVLIERGHDVVIVDNFRNSSPEAVTRLELLLERPIAVERLDLRDRTRLARVFARNRFDAVIHFAALKAVGESCARPLEYFDNNIGGAIALLQEMAAAGVKRLVFSSSATVYGMPDTVPVREDAELRVTNPYGRTKLVTEQLLADVEAGDPAFQVANLRYFNPVGAHASGLIGEAPGGVPGNLMPYVCQVAGGRRERLQVFGGDYPTRDGTGVRDYLHVMDLARAHADALDHLAGDRGGLTVNLGTGRGVSVLELVHAFEAASGRPVPYEIVGRRPGDVAEVFADPSLARERLGWRAELDIEAMCRDAWRWQSLNPDGYRTRAVAAMRARAAVA